MEQDITRDDLHLYSGTLTPEKIRSLYGTAVQNLGPTGYWKLDEPRIALLPEDCLTRVRFNKRTHEVVWEDETETEVTLVIKPR